MDKDHTNIIGTVVGNHNVTISDRKTLMITGVKKIDSFDNEQFLLETSLGYMIIKGEDLEMIKLDTYQGNVSIKGKIDGINYLDSNVSKNKDNSFINKLFK